MSTQRQRVSYTQQEGSGPASAAFWRAVNTHQARPAESREPHAEAGRRPSLKLGRLGCQPAPATAGSERPRTAAAPPKPHARPKARGSTSCVPDSGLGPWDRADTELQAVGNVGTLSSRPCTKQEREQEHGKEAVIPRPH